MKKIIKLLIRKFGLLVFPNPGFVLTYHRIGNFKEDFFQLAVSPDNFREQISVLKSKYQIVSLRSLAEEKNRSGKVALTFDDGYVDNFEILLPIVEELKVPVTVFVSTGLIGKNEEAWWDMLDSIILHNDGLPTSFFLDGTEYSTESSRAKANLVLALHKKVYVMGTAERESFMERLAKDLSYTGSKISQNRMMTLLELQKLAESQFVEIGAHTESHTRLSNLMLENQRTEIENSRFQLEEMIGKPVVGFSYPFGGRRDFNANSKKVVEGLGFVYSTANYAGFIYPWSNIYSLPRFVVRNWTGSKFSKFLTSLYNGTECEFY